MEFYDEKESSVKSMEEENNNKEIQYKVRHKKQKNGDYSNKKKALIILFVVVIVILIALLCCTIFSILNINNTKLIKGITIDKIKIENLSKEEAIQTINQEMQKRIDKDINIKSEGFEYSIKLSQIELEYKIEQAIEEAYKFGRNKNIFANNFDILKSMIKGKDINLEYSYNEEALNKITQDIALKIPGAVEEVSYYIENEKLYISKGKSGNTVNQEELKKEILEKIFKDNNKEIVLEIYNVEPNEIDIEKIYNEVHKEPKDAYYTKNPFKVFPHVSGIDFDIEKAKEILKENKEEYEISLIITNPKITTDKIGTEAFPDLISSFSTRYDSSNIPRSTNLQLAMQKLNGVVVSPGETFSYNKTLGKRTVAAGYKEAGGYEGGRVVQTLAGGICQISSTLYDAVVYANMDIVERHNHMFLAGYVGAGKDATVVYGALDFKFKNTRKYPIMIKTLIGGGTAKVSIYGVKEDVEYDVEISTTILNYIPYKVVYEDDNTLAEGKEKVVQGGMNGCRSVTYKILRLNGKEISRTVLSSDTYDAMNKIIKRGPKKNVVTNTKPERVEPDKKPSIVPQQPETPEEKPVPEPIIPEENKPEEVPEQIPAIPEENLGENIEQNT